MRARQGLQIGFDRDLWLLLSEMFFRRLVMGFLQVVRPIYLYQIGFDPVVVGFITTVGTFVSAVESLIFGTLSDRLGRKPFLLFGSFFSTVRLVLYALSRDFWILVIAQGIGALGEGAGAGQPVVSGYIADKIIMTKRHRVFSVLAISSALSGSIGSLMAGLPAYFQVSLKLEAASSYIPLFWIGVSLNVLATLMILPIKEVKKERENDEDILLPSRLSWKEIGKFCLVRTTDGLGMGLVTTLLPLYFFLRFGVNSENLGPIYALARFLAIPSYFFSPLLADRLGNVKSLLISRIVTGCAIAIFAIAPNFETAATFFVTYRLLFEFAMPMRQAFSSEIVESGQTGTIIGIGNSTRSFVRSFDPTIAGYLFEVASYSTPFFTGAALLIINGIQYYVLYGRKKS